MVVHSHYTPSFGCPCQLLPGALLVLMSSPRFRKEPWPSSLPASCEVEQGRPGRHRSVSRGVQSRERNPCTVGLFWHLLALSFLSILFLSFLSSSSPPTTLTAGSSVSFLFFCGLLSFLSFPPSVTKNKSPHTFDSNSEKYKTREKIERI